MMFKNRIEDYTESEFLSFLKGFEEGEHLEGDQYGTHIYQLARQFKKVVEHPAGTNLIFYPEPDADCTPEGWLAEIKHWMIENGKPGFKPE
ncbi:bacteriocin immunity protein [Pseudomonas sp. UBA6562]|uniref:bacteriocin immunity protein n=1 Tax=Pseudomonas sp. UBA6562 TaxID=1947332 RepID=UPI0025E0117B|nr:bacteriocin immunity protein [Pseudomonas sp. UBA6562]